MGCGKSYFSSQLAISLGLDLYDTDSMIESNTGTSINDIFKSHDESYFRSLEANVAQEIQNGFKGAVFATGGGFPIYYEDILKIGTVFYMDIPFSKILERMTPAERNKRPLFRNIDQAKALYDQRLELYRKRSHYQIDATQSVETMLAFVKDSLNKT